MSKNIPLADDMMESNMHFENSDDIRPNDQIQIGAESTEHFYEVLSIEDGVVDTFDHENLTRQKFTKEEIETIKEQDDAFLWSILSREIIPTESGGSLLFYVYAAEFPEKEDRAILFGWATVNTYPPEEAASTFNEMNAYAQFSQMRDDIAAHEGCFEPLFTEKFGDIEDILDSVAIEAEYNANQMFGLQTEPTYSDEVANRLEESAEPMSEE